MLVQRSRCYVGWRTIVLGVCLAALAALAWPPGGTLAAPSIAVAPARVPCDARVVVRGGGFQPGQAIRFIAYRPGGGLATPLGRLTVPEDGAFAAELEVGQIYGACQPTPRGEQDYFISAGTDRDGGSSLATATITVLSPASMPGLPNTGGGWAAGQPWFPTWGTALALLLAALGGAYVTRSRARRRG